MIVQLLYPPPAVWEQFLGHVSWCRKIYMRKNFLRRVELRDVFFIHPGHFIRFLHSLKKSLQNLKNQRSQSIIVRLLKLQKLGPRVGIVKTRLANDRIKSDFSKGQDIQTMKISQISKHLFLLRWTLVIISFETKSCL